jgi:hypothetical protein
MIVTYQAMLELYKPAKQVTLLEDSRFGFQRTLAWLTQYYNSASSSELPLSIMARLVLTEE